MKEVTYICDRCLKRFSGMAFSGSGWIRVSTQLESKDFCPKCAEIFHEMFHGFLHDYLKGKV